MSDPRDKAKEMFEKMWEEGLSDNQAKECALIAVDEILKAVTVIADKKYDFYIAVKRELNNLK